MTETKFRISAMDCPTEEQIIRNGLKNHPSVAGLEFDLMNRILTVALTPNGSAPAVKNSLDGLGMAAIPVDEDGEKGAAVGEAQTNNLRQRWILMGSAAVFAAAAEVLHWFQEGTKQGGAEKTSPIIIGLVIIALLLGGRDTFRKGWVALRTFTLNINFLMTLAILGAIATGEWPEAAMVAVLFGIAELIERYSLDRARDAIRSLMQTVPETARIWHSHGHDDPGHWHEVGAEHVSVGDRVQVHPGERIPLDGRILEGNSAVEQKAITGESLPVEKQPGDSVFAGTINGRGVLVFEVTAQKGETTLDRIVRAVQEAQGDRAPTQRFVDKFAQYYTPAVVALAVLIAIVPPLLHFGSFLEWFQKALVLLVIACPCALVLSTPVTVVSGLTAAAKLGILIKGGAYLEEGRKIRALALDKTGTLTNGKPVVTDIVPLSGDAPGDMLHLAASLNSVSEHPLAEAIVKACREGHQCRLPEVIDFEALVGRGVTGKLDGRRYYVGNHRLAEENRVCGPHVESVLEKLEKDGKTPVILTSDTEALAVLGVADTLRPDSAEAMRELREMGIETVLLTGDSQHVANAIGREVGITTVRGELLPQDKFTAIENLLAEKGVVGMVGDGINDAPALARASIGFAMGTGGTDTAVDTADVALMDDDLRKLPLFIRLSKATATALTQNIALALGIKAIFLGFALAGKTALWMAVLADVGTSLLVVGNGLRLLRFRPES